LNSCRYPWISLCSLMLELLVSYRLQLLSLSKIVYSLPILLFLTERPDSFYIINVFSLCFVLFVYFSSLFGFQ